MTRVPLWKILNSKRLHEGNSRAAKQTWYRLGLYPPVSPYRRQIFRISLSKNSRLVSRFATAPRIDPRQARWPEAVAANGREFATPGTPSARRKRPWERALLITLRTYERALALRSGPQGRGYCVSFPTIKRGLGKFLAVGSMRARSEVLSYSLAVRPRVTHLS
jgi:hypothetical protein